MTDIDSHLPWPATWAPLRRAPWFAVALFFVLFGALSVLLGVREPGLLLVGGPLMIAIGATIYAHRCRGRGRGRGRLAVELREIDDLTHRGVVFSYSRTVAVANLVLIGYLAAVSWLIALGGLLSGGPVWDRLLMLVFVVVAIVCTWCLAEVALGRLGRGFVALTPEGVYHRSWGVRGYLPWVAVVGVQPVHLAGPVLEIVASANAPGAWARRTSLLQRRRPTGLVPVRGHTLASDPALLYHAATFYLENPTLRPELATPAATTRLHEGRLA